MKTLRLFETAGFCYPLKQHYASCLLLHVLPADDKIHESLYLVFLYFGLWLQILLNILWFFFLLFV
jgi:hypothetical protein